MGRVRGCRILVECAAQWSDRGVILAGRRGPMVGIEMEKSEWNWVFRS